LNEPRWDSPPGFFLFRGETAVARAGETVNLPANASNEPAIRWPDNQLSSMKRRIDDWSVKV